MVLVDFTVPKIVSLKIGDYLKILVLFLINYTSKSGHESFRDCGAVRKGKRAQAGYTKYKV